MPSKKVQVQKYSTYFNKAESTTVFKRFKISGSTLDEKVHWNKLMQIKNPILKAVRYKVFYNDIFSNVRKFKARLSETDCCTMCNGIESTLHQLFECPNAKCMWDLLIKLKLLNLAFINFSSK